MLVLGLARQMTISKRQVPKSAIIRHCHLSLAYRVPAMPEAGRPLEGRQAPKGKLQSLPKLDIVICNLSFVICNLPRIAWHARAVVSNLNMPYMQHEAIKR